MRVAYFDPKKHKVALYEALAARGLPPPPSLPKMGAVAMLGQHCVAFAFVRRVEGGYGMLDGLTSHPRYSSEERDIALDLVVTKVLEIASKNRITQLTATSVHPGTLLRSDKFGFVKLPHTLIAVDLKPRS